MDSYRIIYKGGSGEIVEKKSRFIAEVHPVTEEEVATLMKLIDIARPVPSQNTEIMDIISEEAEAFYNGQKSVDDVAAQIQSRASMYVGENS